MTDKTPHSVLLVSSSEKGVAAISGLIEKINFTPLTTVRNAGEARRLSGVQNFDIIIINAPLSDEFGTELALQFAESTCSGVMLLTKTELYDLVESKTEDMGVITVAKPIDRPQFYHSMKLLAAMRDKYAKLENENKKLKLKLDEVKLVQRAKRMLMECLKMTEPQAHRYIERQAMDMRVTKYEVANAIIRTYTDSY